MKRTIVHMDMDAFYASVEQLLHPEYRGKPLIVGGGHNPDGSSNTNRGVVSTASYEARKYGIGSAMSLFTAMQRCPAAIVVPVDFPTYRAFSARIMALAGEYTPLIEQRSLDEAYLDLTGTEKLFGSGEEVAKTLQWRILTEIGLSASFGVGNSKTVAKIASDFKKPNGITVVPAGREAAWLAPMAVRKMPGVGPKTEEKLIRLDLTTLGAVAGVDPGVLVRNFGVHGRDLWERAQGIDDSPVVSFEEVKSISSEHTLETDTTSRRVLAAEIREQAAEVGSRLRKAGLLGQVVYISMKGADFVSSSRQRSLSQGTDSDLAIIENALELLDQHWNGVPLRLIGVGVSKLHTAELARVGVLAAPREREEKTADQVLDQLSAKFGHEVVRRGAGRGLK